MQAPNAAVLAALAALLTTLLAQMPRAPQEPTLSMAVSASSPLVYSFNDTGVLRETGSMSESQSPFWWLDSGGKLIIRDGIGMTMHGDAPELDYWRLAYAATNPSDTDGGAHPQNLLRLLSRSVWEDVRIEAHLRIDDDHVSASPNRNGSNGLLLMTRYRDSGTLYYAGLRVDGTAVIKKKYHDTYYTMSQKAVFHGSYNRDAGVDLIPHAEWIGLRMEAVTDADGGVLIRLYMQRLGQPGWTEIVSATDRGQFGTTTPIRGPGFVGIRTDFMDVSIDSFKAEEM